MFCAAVLLAGWLTTAQAPQAPKGVADRLTLRDGKVALGLVTNTKTGTCAGVEMLVRRDWAEANLPNWFKIWDRSAQSAAKPAVAQRLSRLKTWRRERRGTPRKTTRSSPGSIARPRGSKTPRRPPQCR